jgi:predicted AAA+ superfamily ATPase
MTNSQDPEYLALLRRIAGALELQAGHPAPAAPDWDSAPAYVWQAAESRLKPVANVNAVALNLLVGLDDHTETLIQNTKRFADGQPANNALLWGARGMGKSSLIKAVHAVFSKDGTTLKLIEIHREDIHTLPVLLDLLRAAPETRFILFCDDLSFDTGDSGYKSLKAALEGGIEGRPDNVLFYATSNRRHLMPRAMIENEQATAVNRGEAVEEKVSLSDRFGLWLGFYPCDQAAYLEMVDRYAAALNINMKKDALHRQALEWAITRGNRSGRVAWQFVQSVG